VTLPVHALPSLLAGRMLNGVIEGMVLAVVAWIVLRCIGRPHSSARFSVWFFTLLAVAIVPWLHGFGSGTLAEGNGSLHTMIAPAAWAMVFLAFWITVAAIGLVRVGLGLWQLRKLRKSSRAVELTALDSELQSVWNESQPARGVELAVCDELRVPTAVGFFRPMVILPAWAIKEFSSEELKSVLIHELAHLRRHDDWTNLAQKILRAVFFFHPAVWWVERQLSLEREMACDDAVLAQTANPHTYAQCLVTMAEKSFLRRGLALAQAAVSRMRQTSQRVSEILQKDRSRATGVWKPAIGVAVVVAMVSVAGLSRVPELVAFQDAAPGVAMATPAPHVVMASFRQPVAEKVWAKSKPKTASANRGAEQKVTAPAVQAKLILPESRLIAVNHAPAVANATPPAVLVVFQTEQFGGPGMVQWTVYFWHVEVVNPSQLRVGPKAPAKSI
jgi:beta-lactamase regulating signal transducer with metallopeptidase domain